MTLVSPGPTGSDDSQVHDRSGLTLALVGARHHDRLHWLVDAAKGNVRAQGTVRFGEGGFERLPPQNDGMAVQLCHPIEVFSRAAACARSPAESDR
jgi:hypothetical protein